MKKKVFITGVNGIVGEGLARVFQKNNFEVLGSYKTKNNLKKIRDIKYLKIDLNSDKYLNKIRNNLKGVEYFIHNAALIPSKFDNRKNTVEQIYKINTFSTKKLIDLCISCKIKKFLFISTVAVFENLLQKKNLKKSKFKAIDDYIMSKFISEEICKTYMYQKQIQISILRVKAPYGYNLNSNAVIQKFIKNTISGKNLVLFNKGQRSQVFTFVNDIGEACLKIFKKKHHVITNLSGPKIISMKSLAENIIGIFSRNKDQKIIYKNKKEKLNKFLFLKNKEFKEIKIKKTNLKKSLLIIKECLENENS